MSDFFHLFRYVLSSLLPLRSVGRSNFDKGLHNLITLIQKRHKNNDRNDVAILCLYIYVCVYRRNTGEIVIQYCKICPFLCMFVVFIQLKANLFNKHVVENTGNFNVVKFCIRNKASIQMLLVSHAHNK